MKYLLNPQLENVLKDQDLVLNLEDLEIDEKYIEDWDYKINVMFKNRGKTCFKTNMLKKRAKQNSNQNRNVVKTASRNKFRPKRKRRF